MNKTYYGKAGVKRIAEEFKEEISEKSGISTFEKIYEVYSQTLSEDVALHKACKFYLELTKYFEHLQIKAKGSDENAVK